MAFKGDLKNVQLADLFQTLAQNRQEGVLTLSSRGRTHRVHFSHAGVTLLDPAVAGRRRLGEILISAGLCTDKDITDALREQAKTKKFLGEVLIEKGRVTQEQLDSILALQVEEEIYELFRTDGGLFEFTEGQPDAVADRAPSKIRPLPVDHVVLEAARRLDEWGQIQRLVPSLDDVYVAQGDPSRHARDEELFTVLQRLDGRHDVRDVADALLSSPFTVAKILVRLLEARAARACRPDELFSSAQALLAGGSKTRALKLLHRLTASESSAGFSNEVAEMYRLAGDSKSAAKTRLRIAQDARAANRLDEARHQLEAALREWPSASAVLEPLVAVLRDLGDEEAELRHVRDLADVLADAGANEGALKAMERVLELAPADFDARRKYSDLCLRARLKEKAIEVLEQEVARLKRVGGGVELTAIYKRILSIDAGRKDVKRALARLRRTRADRLLRAGLVITVGVGLLALAGIVGVRWRQKSVGLARIEAARELYAAGDLEKARAALTEVLNGTARPEVVQPAMTLLDEIDTRVTESTRAKRGEKDDAFNKKLAAIQDQAARLNFDVAFGDCARLLQTDLEPYMVERVDARLLMIKQTFLDTIARAKESARSYHEPERDEDVPAVFKKMSDAFPVELVALLPNVRTVAFESAQKLKSPPRDWMLEVLTAVDSFDLMLARVKPALDSLRARNVRLSTLQQLSIDYLEAVRMAEAGNIERSRELLRKVRDEYGQGELRAVLDKRLQRLDAAATCIQQIEEHLQNKEYVAAHDQALSAAREYRDLQIPSTLGIPVLLKSVPPGARIVVDGKEEGRAPLVMRVPLGSKPSVHATLEHYTSVDSTIDPSAGAEQSVELERARVTEASLPSKFVAAPLWHEGRLCAASRDGVLYAVEFGTAESVNKVPVVKSLRTGSVSGSLVPPVGAPRGFLASVFEGKVWRIDATGPELSAVWTRDLKEETRSPLVVVGELVLVTTDNGRVVALALADGSPVFEVALNGRRVVGAPVFAAGRLLVPLAGGALAAVDPGTRSLAGVRDVGAELVGALASDGTVVVATSSTGMLLAFDATTLAPRASVQLDDLSTDPPRVAWPRADVVVRRGIAVVDLAAQRVVRTVEATPTPTSAPVLMDGLLFVGSEKGVLCAFDPEGDEARLRLHLPSNAAVGAPIGTPLGWLAFTRDGAAVILQR
jgi:outer membrane protein assembly factor BamB/tetratricopeptide (TPR) repeat protein